MDGLDLTEEMYAAMRENKTLVDDMHRLAVQAAEAEREYRMAKAEKMLELRTAGYPATLIPDLVKGDEDVSYLCFTRDCTNGEYEANREAIMFYKRKADRIAEQIAREWGKP